MTRTMSLSAYARHRGVAPSAVTRARRTGRLSQSIGTGRDGAPYVKDVEAADREWAANSDYTFRIDYLRPPKARAVDPDARRSDIPRELGEVARDPEGRIPLEQFSVLTGQNLGNPNEDLVALAWSPRFENDDAAIILPMTSETAAQVAVRLLTDAGVKSPSTPPAPWCFAYVKRRRLVQRRSV
jgi:hypothetical protein